MTAFGTIFSEKMAITWFKEGSWSEPAMVPSNEITIHPAAHVLHYASTCFEGVKAFRQPDGSVAIFRLDDNVERFEKSAACLHIPFPGKSVVKSMILDAVKQFKDDVPEAPGTLYIRPTLMGTQPCIGSAAAPSNEACYFVLLSPVGDYFDADKSALKILIDDTHHRTAPDSGFIKAGANYALALKHIEKAKESHGANQVLFSPNGDMQETGAANFLFLHDNTLYTKSLDDSFLHGVTRKSLLQLAIDKGYNVKEQEKLDVEFVVNNSANSEAGLSGTAAVLASIGEFVYQDKSYTLGNGEPGPKMAELRKEMNDIQFGRIEDRHNWLTTV